jgi:NAD(P)-dependent dehydrogenase (short-subunit alcohol dehydrogenase family)
VIAEFANGGPNAVSIEINLSGRIVFVSGAGAGIGAGIATWFARSGAHVIVNDIVEERARAVVDAVTAQGGSASPQVANVRDEMAVKEMFEKIISEHGHLDVVVNNVGNLPEGRAITPFVTMDGDYWLDLVTQDLFSAVHCARFGARAIKNNGVILFVSSGETTRPSPGNGAYAASKAAINHLVMTLAVELGPVGIRVCAIAPGTTATETIRAVLSDEVLEAFAQATPLQRSVAVDELGPLAVFLASDLARCVTGQFILADAGAFLSRQRPALPQSVYIK